MLPVPSTRSTVAPGQRRGTTPFSVMGALASPLGLAVIIPLFILIGGGTSLGISQALIRRSLNEQAEQTTLAYSHAVANTVSAMLQQAGPILEHLRNIAQGPRDDQLQAHALSGLVESRRGLSSIGYATDQGSYVGIKWDGGQWRMLRMSSDFWGRMQRTENLLAEAGTIGPVVEGSGAPFDPRQRPWYVAAKQASGRIWIDHLQFSGPGQGPGHEAIFCAEKLLGLGSKSGVAVVTFNIDTLSQALEPLSEDPLVDNVLLTPDRTILAMPHDWNAPATEPAANTPAASTPGAESPPPDLAAFREALPDLTAIGPTGTRISFLSHGEERECIIMPCQVPAGPKLLLAQVISRNLLNGKAKAALTESLVWSLSVMACGIVTAWWFAGRLAALRRKAIAQQQRAEAAEADLERLGSYRLITKLGTGGMGEVWLGEHTFLARRAAIKRITPTMFRDLSPAEREAISARFDTEARITAALRSRCTVELYDFGVAKDGSFYYVMEFLDGITLGTLVDHHGPQPIERVLKLLIQVCGSLGEAHSYGLVHRDIKLENIFLCRRAQEVDLIKVIDFGIVRPPPKVADKRHAHDIVGTPSTIAPEQARGQPLDGRADLYALGCVAFSLLTGHDVFRALSTSQLIQAHVEQPPPLVSQQRRDVPPELDRIIARCLAKNPDERPASAQELADLLSTVPVPDNERWTEAACRAWWNASLPEDTAGILRHATELPPPRRSIASFTTLALPPSARAPARGTAAAAVEATTGEPATSDEPSTSETSEALALVERIQRYLRRSS
jgi:serine/threonine protein kinase